MATALQYYKKHSKTALLALAANVEANPESRNPPGDNSLFIYTPAVRKKLAAISQAVTWHMADDRAKAGNPVPVAGYSGRSTNRR